MKNNRRATINQVASEWVNMIGGEREVDGELRVVCTRSESMRVYNDGTIYSYGLLIGTGLVLLLLPSFILIANRCKRFVLQPFSDNKFDLIICNFNFHNILDKKDYLNNLNSILSEGGLLICNFFGENSLVELRRSLILTDEELYNGSFLRIQKNITMNEFSNLLIKSGFKDIVNEKINYQIYYKNIISLLKDIRGIGENSGMDLKEIKISKGYIKLLEMIYKKKFSNTDNQLKLSVDIISSCSWKN